MSPLSQSETWLEDFPERRFPIFVSPIAGVKEIEGIVQWGLVLLGFSVQIDKFQLVLGRRHGDYLNGINHFFVTVDPPTKIWQIANEGTLWERGC